MASFMTRQAGDIDASGASQLCMKWSSLSQTTITIFLFEMGENQRNHHPMNNAESWQKMALISSSWHEHKDMF